MKYPFICPPCRRNTHQNAQVVDNASFVLHMFTDRFVIDVFVSEELQVVAVSRASCGLCCYLLGQISTLDM